MIAEKCHTRNASRLAVSLAVAALATTGCTARTPGARYQTIPRAADRDTARALQLNDRGLEAIEHGDLPAAEQRFRESLDQDLYYAPAHNNLGLVLLQTGRYYEAAWEFEYAKNLAPTSAEPRDNLGLLYERIGRLDRAITEYEGAIDLDPKQLAPMQHLARAYVKAGRKGKELKDVLEKLLAIPQDRQWDTWVRGQIVRLGRPESPDDPPPP